MNSIEKLVAIGSNPLHKESPVVETAELMAHSLGEELLGMLRQKNGFYAFESALHIFPEGPFRHEMTVSRWNSSDLWRYEYGDLAHQMLFFAEDAFGNQFCFHKGLVCSFEAETGQVEFLGRTLEDWAMTILAKYEGLTGYTLLHKWQLRSGALPSGMRLMPKVPFVLGGDYQIDNLYALAAVRAMKTRGNLARQLKDLPDGAQVQFRVVE